MDFTLNIQRKTTASNCSATRLTKTYTIMTKTRDIRLRYRPTQEQLDAIAHLHKSQQRTEVYSGKWTTFDTVRDIISRPFVANNYPANIKRVAASKTLNVSKAFLESLSPALDKEPPATHFYRLLSSGLVQMGYLKMDEAEPGPIATTNTHPARSPSP